MTPRFTHALILTGLTLAPFAGAYAQTDTAPANAASSLPADAVIAPPARSDADRSKDALRKPLDLLALTPLPKAPPWPI